MQDNQDLKTPYKVIRGNGSNTITLYLEDCIDGMNHALSEKSIDVAVTSPPYNIGVEYETYRDNLPREEYVTWMNKMGIAVRRVLDDKGSFFLNIGNTPKDQWIAWDVARVLRKHFVLQNVIHWVKSIAISKADVGNYPGIKGDIAVGHFEPIASNRFLNDCHEYIFHFTKKGDVRLRKMAIGVPYRDKSNITRWKATREDKLDRRNTWFIPYEAIQFTSEYPHPATFPVKLPETCIKLHGLHDGMVVLDPFLGIGSSAVAALRLGTSFVGFEIGRGYMDEAIERLNNSIKAHSSS